MPIQAPSLEEFIQLLKRVEALEEQLKTLESSPLYLEWVSVDEACEILGIKSRATIRRMCRDGRLRYKKGIRKVHIHYPSIIEYNNTLKI